MRHIIAHRKFGRTTNQRKALLSGLANVLIEKEHIVTTLPKAKDLRPIVERLVTLGKRAEPLSAYRKAKSFLGQESSCKKLLTVLSVRHKDRAGGYLRILKAGYRYGDNAPLAVIEFVDYKRSAPKKAL